MSNDNTILADRYKMLIANERDSLLSLFTENEWELLRAVFVGVEFKTENDIRDGVLHLIKDALDIEFDQLNVSRTQIEGKLQSLTILQQFALVEELENFWIQIHRETEEARKK